MIPSFNYYNLLKESVSLGDLAKGNKRNLSYSDMKNGFLSKGYDFLGTLTMKVKMVNAFAYQEVLDTVPDEFIEKLQVCGKDYVTFTPDKSHLDMSIYKKEYGEDVLDSEKFLMYLAAMAIENVSSCFTKKGSLYYVLWNKENKYFYFAHIDDSYYANNNGAIGFFELWLKIRTAGVDAVKEEIDVLYAEYEEKENQREEEARLNREAEELKKEKDAVYQKRVDAIQADVEANPDNYVEVEEKDLPQEILDVINSDDLMDSEYAVYIEHGPRDPYDVETATCYVNNDELNSGYKFTKQINHSRPGTYWGD